MRFHALTFLAIAAAGAAPLRAQLPLREALQRADRHAFAVRAAASRSGAQHARSLAPLRGILPSLRFEGGFVRTSDPLAAFAATLQQRAIAPADFDPARLNAPAPVGNYQAGIVFEQPIFNADAWLGRRAATRAAGAGDLALAWTRYSTRADVIRAYYGAILAADRVTTLDAAARAAHGHVSRAESMVRNGLATKSDALLASVRAGETDALLAGARGDAATAVSQLQLLLGDDAGASLTLTADLPTRERIIAIVAPDTASLPGATRADVAAAGAALDAARADARRAQAAYLPRLNSFARYDWNSAGRFYGGERSWTVGIMASWSPFAGASQLSNVQATGAAAATARADAEAAEAQAHLDVERSASALRVALARLDIAERAVAQGGEAHRIVARKYDGGLATVVELLDAQSVETQSRLAFSQARFAAIAAAADHRRALGLDPGSLASLDDASGVASAPQDPRR